MKARSIFAALIGLLLFLDVAAAQDSLTAEERGWLAKATRSEDNGWIHVKIGGAPFERGFQHGYLLAAEFKDAWRVYDAMTLQTTGLGLDFFVEKAADFTNRRSLPSNSRRCGASPPALPRPVPRPR
jgi:hypothetical protein